MARYEQETEDFNIDLYTNDVNNQISISVSFKEKVGFKVIENIPESQVVDTISPHWLSLESLSEEYKYSETYLKNIQELSSTYCGWRKVRGDGNCYYRSVISIYILKIFHFNDDQQRVLRLLGILRKIGSSDLISQDISEYEEYMEALRSITDIFNYLYLNRTNDSLKNFCIISHLLQDKEFDLKLIRVSRLLSYAAIIGPEGEKVMPFVLEDEIEPMKDRILRMGTEAEGVELSLCPIALDIIVKQINVFDNLLFNTFPIDSENFDNSFAKFVIHIISKSKGHYDSLYAIGDMEQDDYCIDENLYQIDIDKKLPCVGRQLIDKMYENMKTPRDESGISSNR